MWLMTQHGFFSVIQNAEDRYFVRARVRADLGNILRLLAWDHEIHEWKTADYRYRIIVTKDELLQLFVRIGEQIDYGNFKGRIHELRDQKAKSAAYGTVWAVMADLQR